MTPNRDEAFELARQIPELTPHSKVEELGQAFMKTLGAPNMMITLGAEGMKIFNGQNQTHIPTFAKTVFDVTGAGDTVISAVALGMSAGWSLEKAGYFANVAAGVVVGHVGAVACNLHELRGELSRQLTA